MTLQSSGAISLSQVNTELGRSSTAAISLGETAVRTLAGVPSGAISMSNLYGKSSVIVSVFDTNINAVRVGLVGTATAAYQLDSIGRIFRVVNGSATQIGNWVIPALEASNYEVYATGTEGFITGSPLGSWLALSSTRQWTVTQGTYGERSDILIVEIRKIGTTTVLDTATIGLTASKEP